MSGIPLREAALTAVAARLTAQIPTAVVERARRVPVDTDVESLPRLILLGGAMPRSVISDAKLRACIPVVPTIMLHRREAG